MSLQIELSLETWSIMWMVAYMTLIPALEGLRQENFVVEDSLGYIAILYLKKKKKLTKLHAHLEKLCT